jgi:molecular chaperone GrpE
MIDYPENQHPDEIPDTDDGEPSDVEDWQLEEDGIEELDTGSGEDDEDDEDDEDGEDAPTEKSPVEQTAELKDQLLRALAETQNVRRRAERERADTSKYAITNFARDVLTVADNLRRSIDSAAVGSSPVTADDGTAGGALLAGIEMTERDLLASLERHGIRPISPIGDKFDHNFHQAMFEIETQDQEPGTVMQMVQAGYVIGDRLLRPAMVGIAKAPANPGGDTTMESESNLDTEA